MDLRELRKNWEIEMVGNRTRKTCRKPGCKKKAESAGLCKKHKDEPTFVSKTK